MPVAKVWPIEKLIEAARMYVKTTGRRVIVEYTLIKGVNDSRIMRRTRRQAQGDPVPC